MVIVTGSAGQAQRQPPYAGYAGIMSTFAGGLVAAGALAKHRDAREHTPLDLAVASFATFKAARTIARDEVTSFIRAPFVAGEAHEGKEDLIETGDLYQAIGELVTCSRCIGTWCAAGLASPQILAPRFGRLLAWSLAAAGTNDWLQGGFATLTHKSDEVAQRTR
jgi:Protein of unknown function (DUF1360)